MACGIKIVSAKVLILQYNGNYKNPDSQLITLLYLVII